MGESNTELSSAKTVLFWGARILCAGRDAVCLVGAVRLLVECFIPLPIAWVVLSESRFYLAVTLVLFVRATCALFALQEKNLEQCVKAVAPFIVPSMGYSFLFFFGTKTFYVGAAAIVLSSFILDFLWKVTVRSQNEENSNAL